MALTWGVRKDLLYGTPEYPNSQWAFFLSIFFQFRSRIQRLSSGSNLQNHYSFFPFKFVLLSLPCFAYYPDFHVLSKIIGCGKINEFPNCLTTSQLEQFLNVPLSQVFFCLVFIHVYLEMSSFASCISFILYAACLRNIFQRITEFH